MSGEIKKPIVVTDSLRTRFAASFSVQPDGCWLWTGTITTGGYGVINSANGQYRAHRVSFAIHRGELDRALELDHLCRVRACVNPNHLEQVTTRVNQLRGYSQSGIHARSEVCLRGHPWSDNKKVRLGYRFCLICDAERARAYRARKKQAV